MAYDQVAAVVKAKGHGMDGFVRPAAVAPSFHIRDYTLSDAEPVLALIISVLSAYGFSPDIGGLHRDLELVAARYGRDRSGFWVSERDGALVGTVAVRPKDALTCELKRLYVNPIARGLGIGQGLYIHAETFARSAGYENMWLDSSRRFAQARRLYERNGFVLVEELDNDWEDNVYEKELVRKP
jgi:putative acetyltransferase